MSSTCKVSRSKFPLCWAGFLQITVSVFQRNFLSFPFLRCTIKTSLFEGSLAEDTSPCVGLRVAGGQLRRCQEQAGSAGLWWAAHSQQRFLPGWEGSSSCPTAGTGRAEPWTTASKYLGARQEGLSGQQGPFWVFLILCAVCLPSASAAMLQEAGGHRRGAPQLGSGQWCLSWGAAGGQDTLVPLRISWSCAAHARRKAPGALVAAE